MYITNYPVFFQCYFRSKTGILIAVCSFWIVIQKSFLERGLHTSTNGRFIFSGGFIFRCRGHPSRAESALMGRGMGNSWSKRHPIMPLPTRANPGLCCNWIKKKHELRYVPENLQEKDLNFTRKGTSSQIYI